MGTFNHRDEYLFDILSMPYYFRILRFPKFVLRKDVLRQCRYLFQELMLK